MRVLKQIGTKKNTSVQICGDIGGGQFVLFFLQKLRNYCVTKGLYSCSITNFTQFTNILQILLGNIIFLNQFDVEAELLFILTFCREEEDQTTEECNKEGDTPSQVI